MSKQEELESIILECVEDKLGVQFEESAKLTRAIFLELEDTLTTQYTGNVKALRVAVEIMINAAVVNKTLSEQTTVLEGLKNTLEDTVKVKEEQGARLDNLYPS